MVGRDEVARIRRLGEAAVEVDGVWMDDDAAVDASELEVDEEAGEPQADEEAEAPWIDRQQRSHTRASTTGEAGES
jgi:hypothetical protein